MKKYELYTESRKRFKAHYGEKLQGYVLWETYLDNFKLECWNVEDNGDTFAIDIFQTGCQVFRYSTYNGEIITTEGVNRMDATYKAVVEFIEWYNEQNKYICGSCGLHVEQVYYDEERDADFCNDCKF